MAQTSAPSKIPSPERPAVLDMRGALYFGLRLGGFLGSTLLLSWGLFALFFLAIGGFSLDGLMHQLNNLSARYIAATPDRVTSFKSTVAAAQIILAAGLIVLRRHRIMPGDRSKGVAPNG